MDTLKALIILNTQKTFHNTPTEMLLDKRTRATNTLRLKQAVRAYLEAEEGANVERIIETGIDMYDVVVKILKFYKVPEDH